MNIQKVVDNVAKKNSIKKIKPLVVKFIDKLREQNLPVLKVYIYGSYAKGTPHKYSDIDVCVISPQFKDRFDATQYLLNMREGLELDIEPVAFSPDDFVDENPLVWEIKQHGVEIPIESE